MSCLLLSFQLLAPAQSATPGVIGEVMLAFENVTLDGESVPEGTSIFAGQEIVVTKDSALFSVVNGGRLQLFQDSRLVMEGRGKEPNIAPKNGHVVFATTAEQGLLFSLEQGKVYAEPHALGDVVVSPGQCIVAARTGRVRVETIDGQTVALKSGQQVTLMAQRPTPGQLPPGGVEEVRRWRKIARILVIVGAIAAAVAIPLALRDGRRPPVISP